MFSRLWPFGRVRPDLAAGLAERVARWRAMAEFERERPTAVGRWVVVDVETSGLDAMRDSLIAVGAIAVVDGAIDLADSFEVVLRQHRPSEAGNIEIHGIGGTEQAEGREPAEALVEFLEFIGKDPLVAFHAPFDSIMLRRAIDRHIGFAFRRPWVDLAEIAPLVWPRYASRLSGLDDWLEVFSIPVAFRHRAIADCMATAQLLLIVLPHSRSIGASSADSLVALSGAHRGF